MTDLYDKLSKLRLLAAVLYDQGKAAGLSESEIEETIQPLRHNHEKLIDDAIEKNLSEVIIAVKNYEDDAEADSQKARRHREKSEEARIHAAKIKARLREHMLARGQVERIQGNYMATITDGKIELR